MADSLEERVDTMKREIDGLQIAVMSSNKAWYRNPSVLISAMALAFSFGTTYVSSKRSDALEIQSSRQELRGVLQRLAALPKENLEALKKYAGDPSAAMLVGGFINQENAMLARQAAEIARKLPRDLVSPTELYAVALALQNAYELSGAREFLGLSLAQAEARADFNSEIGALRSLAALHFVTGDPARGRAEFKRAQDIFARYPGFDPYTKASTGVWTELAWASAEAIARAPDDVRQHLDAASGLIDGLVPSPGRDALSAQVMQARVQFLAMGQVASPSSAAPIALPQLKP